MAKRSFLMLAHSYDHKKIGVGGWFLSEKLDGQRCFWDGGISRGFPKREVPWANNSKDARYREQQTSTGLWSRYGNVIHAPDWWLDSLPKIPLDGELYIDVNSRQELMETVRSIKPNDDKWKNVCYHVFDLVPLESIFSNGTINEVNFKILLNSCVDWAKDQKDRLEYWPKTTTQFQDTLKLMDKFLPDNDICCQLSQAQLPFKTSEAESQLYGLLENVTKRGGEGLVLRNPISNWIPERSKHLLKVKKFDDDEGVVVGYVTGRKTDKGSKLLGKMGALILDYKGQRLELSGFTDEERELTSVNRDNDADAKEWACDYPETECPDWIEAKQFPRGSKVTFLYRGKSRDGVPQEARFKRRREES